MAKMAKISGFPEWLPEQKLIEDSVIRKIRAVYESFGFTPIETPAIELLTTLGSKGVIDKEIFAVKRYHAQGEDGAEFGLHFDLTVPLARYVAQHAHLLNFPFKRYQLQKVWRGERPQRGRAREFYQFDIDIIAREELPIACDAEVLTMVGLVMQTLDVGRFEVRVNNRKLLSGLYEALGLGEMERKAAIIAVDKLKKIGPAGVEGELRKISGISDDAVTAILRSTQVQCPLNDLPSKVAELGIVHPVMQQGLDELAAIGSLIPEDMHGVILADLSLARGLDYYTGIIIETEMTDHPEFGSVLSGGRYDNLASEFTDQKLPGVGVSLGLTRLMDLVFFHNLIPVQKRTPTDVLVTVYSESDRPRANRVAQEMRDAGLCAEVFYRAPKLGKQIEYAEGKGIRYVAFIDGTTGAVQIKDIVTKEQAPIDSISVWTQSIRTRA